MGAGGGWFVVRRCCRWALALVIVVVICVGGWVGQCDVARVWGPLCIVVVIQSARDPPYEQWLVGVGVLCHSSSSSNLHLRSPPFPLQCHHSTHHPPHKQMLVRLGTGGGRGGIGFPPCCSRLPSPSVFVVVPPVIHPPSSCSQGWGGWCVVHHRGWLW
jgi:hypothetical protein